jgi:hypothetical protein
MYAFCYDAESQAAAAAAKHEEEDEDEDEDELDQEDGLLSLLSAHIHSSIGDVCSRLRGGGGGGGALRRSPSSSTRYTPIKPLLSLYTGCIEGISRVQQEE